MLPFTYIRRFSPILTGAILLALMYGCGGTLFKVKPYVASPMPDVAKTGESNGVVAKALPLLTDQENQDLFEANLPLNGILPIRVEIVNSSSGPLMLNKVHFTMRDAGGGAWKLLTTKQTTSRIMKANDIVLFNPAAKKTLTKEIGAYSFDTKTPLGQGERRQGLLFFQTPRKEPVEDPKGLLLTIDRGGLTIKISLT